jgi:hypothetical protein
MNRAGLSRNLLMDRQQPADLMPDLKFSADMVTGR